VIVPWTIRGLLNELTARGEHPAVISFGEDGVVTWRSKVLAEKALSLARGLRENGVDKAALLRSGHPTRWSGSPQLWASCCRAGC
jgi:hypothetical protein